MGEYHLTKWTESASLIYRFSFAQNSSAGPRAHILIIPRLLITSSQDRFRRKTRHLLPPHLCNPIPHPILDVSNSAKHARFPSRYVASPCVVLLGRLTSFVPAVQVAIGSLIVPPTLVPTKATPKLPLFAFALLTFATVIFRLELAGLLVPLALEQLVRGTVSYVPLVLTGLGSAATSLGEHPSLVISLMTRN